MQVNNFFMKLFRFGAKMQSQKIWARNSIFLDNWAQRISMLAWQSSEHHPLQEHVKSRVKMYGVPNRIVSNISLRIS